MSQETQEKRHVCVKFETFPAISSCGIFSSCILSLHPAGVSSFLCVTPEVALEHVHNSYDFYKVALLKSLWN